MEVKKTYIPAKFRNPKLVNSGGSNTTVQGGGGSSTEGHTHNNKSVLDKITDATLEGANREIITTESESLPTDENLYSALKTKEEIDEIAGAINDKLSKIDDDEAQGIITLLKGLVSKGKSIFEDDAEFWRLILAKAGINVGQFSSGLFGSGATLRMNNGVSELEVDKLLVRMRAEFFSVLIHNAKHIGGELVMSPAEMICNKVEDFTDFYRCYFDRGENNEVQNLFTNKDFARCQVFTGTGQKFYWRKVVAVGTDYIELSKTDAVAGSDVPEVGDHIYQLGSTDIERQSAMILSTVGLDAPSFKQYVGINSMSLAGKETTEFTSKGNKITGKTVFLSDGSNLEDWSDGITGDITEAQQKALDAERKAQQAIQDAENAVSDYNAKFALQQQQIDGQISSWFYPYSPTLNNIPASLWTTNEEKDRHIGDTFTNTQQIPLLDAGKSWRFVKNGSVYEWTQISDSDALLALQKASEAQSTADGKSTTFLVQPHGYDVGDMWVLGSDLTVNGTAYKQGEILTANQASVTYNQAHWVKRVRYTDDSAVDNLGIGSRNIVLKGGNYREIIASKAGWIHYTLSKNLEQGKRYRVLVETLELSESSSVSLKLLNKINGYNNDVVQTVPFNGYFTANSSDAVSIAFTKNFDTDSKPLIVQNIAIYQGNKCIEVFTPAPEDIQASIDAVQSNVNTVSSTVSNLNTYIDGAFKDGVIDSAEATTIAQLIKTVQAENDKMLATYDKLFLNSYLEGTAKTSLQQNKITFVGAVNDVITAINTAIADSKITPTERNNVNAKFNAYKTALADFSTAIENANKAIQTKLDTLSTEKVNNLQIGGVNLLELNSSKWEQGSISSTATGSGDQSASTRIRHKEYFPCVSGFDYTVKKHSSLGKIIIVFYDENKDRIINRGWYTIEGVITSPSNAAYFRAVLAFEDDSNITLSALSSLKFKLEKGNKATDWTPAPEDIQASIDQAQADAVMARSVTDQFGTIHNGGLISPVTILLREINTLIETAGLTGHQGVNRDQPAYWAGGDYEQAIAVVNFMSKINKGQTPTLGEYANLARVMIGHDGASKLGHLLVQESGQVTMINPDTGKPRLIFQNENIPGIEKLHGSNSSSNNITATGTSVNSTITPTSYLGGTLNIPTDNSDLTVSGGALIQVQIGGLVSNPNYSATLLLELMKDGVAYRSIGNLRVTPNTPSASFNVRSQVFNSVPAGNYRLRLRLIEDGGTYNVTGSVGNTPLSYSFQKSNVRYLQFGLDGMMAYFANMHFHLTEDGGLDYRGAMNMPGVLCSGSVSSGGIMSNKWGAKNRDNNEVTRPSVGVYNVYHNIGHSNYNVSVTPHGEALASVQYMYATYFVVQMRGRGQGELMYSGFQFQAFGSNY